MNENDGSWRSGLLAVAIVAAAGAGGWALFKSGPKTQSEDEVRAPKIVKTIRVQPQAHSISVAAHGTVVAARELTIEPEVSGQIVRLHEALASGGVIRKGEELMAIDTTLADLDLEEAKAAVERSEAELKEAERKRNEARTLADETLLSKTELAALEADLETELADLRRLKAAQTRAEEMLKRHRIVAPFNALVLSESVEVGQRVDAGFDAATLVGTDEFWVQAALPVDRLKHVRIPAGERSGADVVIHLETGAAVGASRKGAVLRLLGDMESSGRMARVLISVNDPLGLRADTGSDSTPFLLGSYVRAEIDAGQLEDVLSINRSALRDGNRIWVANEKGELQIKDAEVVWKENETIFIRNIIVGGETLIVSPLKVALPGMKVNAQLGEPDNSGKADESTSRDSGG